jgi:hypothetical protein
MKIIKIFYVPVYVALLSLSVLSCGEPNSKPNSNDAKKSKNPAQVAYSILREGYSSISEIKNMHPREIIIQRWVDANSSPQQSFSIEIGKKLEQKFKRQLKTGEEVDKAVDAYLNDSNNVEAIAREEARYCHDPNNWITEVKVTDIQELQLIMSLLGSPQKIDEEIWYMAWDERIGFEDSRGKVKWLPFVIHPEMGEVYIGEGYYSSRTFFEFKRMLGIVCECHRRK